TWPGRSNPTRLADGSAPGRFVSRGARPRTKRRDQPPGALPLRSMAGRRQLPTLRSMTERPTPAAASAIPMGSGELAAALRDPDPFVRVDALGRAEGNARAFELIGSALSDDYPLLRRAAGRALP